MGDKRITEEQLASLRALSQARREAEDAEAALLDSLPDVDEPPPELPVADIHDAEPVKAGDVFDFEVKLSASSVTTVTIEWIADDPRVVLGGVLTFAPGSTTHWIAVETDARDAGQIVTVELRNPVGCTIGDGTASGTVLPAEPGDPDDPLRDALLVMEPAAPITQPIDFPAGKLIGLQAVAMVVRYAPGTKHQKFMGGASTEDERGAFCIGMNPNHSTNIWRSGGGQLSVLSPGPTMPTNQAVFLVWGASLSQSAGVSGAGLSQGPLVPPLAAVDGPAAVGAGYWHGVRVDPLAPGSEVRALVAWPYVPTSAQLEKLKARWQHLADNGPPGNGNGGNGGGNGGSGPPPQGLEPPVGSAVQVSLDVGAPLGKPFRGFGWGADGRANAKANSSKVRQYIKMLMQDIGAVGVRTWTPEANSGITHVQAYKEITDAARANGAQWCQAVGFAGTSNLSPEAWAEGIARSIDAGAWITHVSPNNEPDAPANEFDVATVADFVRRARRRLDELGHSKVKIIGCDWAHFASPGAIAELNNLKAAGLVPATVVAGNGHCYSDCPRPSIARDGWHKAGGELWATETGNYGLPNGIARSISALTHGCTVETFHIGYSASSNDQCLIFGNGGKSQWYGHYVTLFGQASGVPIGTVWREIASSDRPTNMSADYAKWMVRSRGANPRLQAAMGRTPNGKMWSVACNTTQGSGVQANHVGACYAATPIQPTFKVTEMAGKNATFEVREVGGATYTVAMVDGHVRTKPLAPGATAVIREG